MDLNLAALEVMVLTVLDQFLLGLLGLLTLLGLLDNVTKWRKSSNTNVFI